MRSNQSKLYSFIEANVNTAVGFVLSVLCWKYVVALVWVELEPHTGWGTSIGITLLFTILSIFRNYTVRRIFNRFL